MQNTEEKVRPNRIVTLSLLIWMLGMMLLGWFLMDGPGLSSVIKRVGPFKRAQTVLRGWLGEPAEPTSAPDGESQL